MTEDEQKAFARAQARYRQQLLAWAESGLKANLSTRNGRAFVWWLLDITRVYENPYRDNALKTAFNSGELNIGLQIQARLMETDPDGFVAMMKEVANERRGLEQSYTTPDAGNAAGGDEQPVTDWNPTERGGG